MKFGDIPIDEACGAVLAHSIRLGDARLAKGRVLDAADVARLDAAGLRSVMAAVLEVGDIPEDDAAARIALALAHPSLLVAEATTGRVNIAAVADGLCLVDAETINRINTVHESITVATVEPYQTVGAGQIVATVKIIPFAIERQRLDAVLAIGCAGGLRVEAFAQRRVGVIFSELPAVPFKGREKAERVLSERLAALGGTIDDVVECEHEAVAVADAVRSLAKRGSDLILMFGASAIVDRGDVIPAGIVRAGGEVRYFGMPVDPGNMLLLGQLGSIDVIGLPGCARSPKFNGFDWVLQRLFAKLPLSGSDIAGMGVGGLLG